MLAMATLLLMLGLSGCGLLGSAPQQHHLQTAGTTMMLTKPIEGAEAAGPDGKGGLVVGKVDIPAGVLFQQPRTDKELIDMLKSIGVKIEPKKEP